MTGDTPLLQQMLAARAAGADHFIDSQTKTLITVDPATGMPGPFGMWVRALRIQQQEADGRWWRRAARAVRAAFTKRPRWPAPPPRPYGGLGVGDGEDD